MDPSGRKEPISPKSVLLIHPPVSKPCEPPPGIARLFGALGGSGIKCAVLDANWEGLLHLLNRPLTREDTWSRRASRNLSSHLCSLKRWPTYGNLPRYKRAVMDLNRLVQVAAIPHRVNLTLTNYQHKNLSPVRSQDLLQAAENPGCDPFYPYFEKRLKEVVDREGISLVGLSLNYLSQALTTFAMIGFLKKAYPRLKVVLGGGLLTSWMRRPGWKDPFSGLVDFPVAGPGEVPLLSLLGFAEPQGEFYSPPDYEVLPWGEYLAPGAILPYNASTGCYWNRCLFCPEREEKNPYRPISVDRVFLDLNSLMKKKRPVLIHFLDNAIPPAVLKRLADRPLGAPWYGFARFTDYLADLDFCLALRRSGCVLLQLGLESGDQGVLDGLEKGIDLQLAPLILKNLKKVGVATYVYLLFGTPLETETEARKTMEFTAQHRDQIDFLNLAIFNLPARGDEPQKLEVRKFYEGDLSLYVHFDHPRGWDRNRVRTFLDKEFHRHPAIAPILRRDPPFFTSNHAPFFVMGC